MAKKEEEKGKGEQKFAPAAAADVILEAMIDGVSIADINGNMIQANSAFVKMLGYESPKDLIGESIVNVIADKDIPKTMEELKKCITKDIVMNVEFGMKRKDGSEFPCMLNGTALKDEKGNIVGLIGTMRDITEFKKTQQKEQELAAAAAAAAAADRKRAAELENTYKETQQKTVELEKAYKELREKSERLERFHKVTVGRELEMVELKKEINSLLEKSGQPKKYEAPDKIKRTEEKG